MPDIEVALNYALAQIGKPYSTGSNRFGPYQFDCSGLVIRSLVEAGIKMPNGIGIGSGNSVSLYNWAKSVGGLVSVDRAIRTRGAILIRGRWYGYGPLGDVKFSLGDGRQTGAGSRRTGVATRTVFSNFFHDGFIIPGVNYGAIPPIIPPKKISKDQDMIQQPNRTGTPAGRHAVVGLSPDGTYIEEWNGASIARDEHHANDPSNLRRWYPRDGKGNLFLPPGHTYRGISAHLKGNGITACRDDGATVDGFWS